MADLNPLLACLGCCVFFLPSSQGFGFRRAPEECASTGGEEMGTGEENDQGQQEVPPGAGGGPIGAEGGPSGPQDPVAGSSREGAAEEAYPPLEGSAAAMGAFSGFSSKVSRNRNPAECLVKCSKRLASQWRAATVSMSLSSYFLKFCLPAFLVTGGGHLE